MPSIATLAHWHLLLVLTVPPFALHLLPLPACFPRAAEAASRAVALSNAHIDAVGLRSMATAARCSVVALLKVQWWCWWCW
jgi:hypothetical protein